MIKTMQEVGEYSPHAWGWTYYQKMSLVFPIVFPTRVGMDHGIDRNLSIGIVFPTRVGMDRCSTKGRWRSSSIPHTRGDGPLNVIYLIPSYQYSPHAWGWTVFSQSTEAGRCVFPTRVGMDLLINGDEIIRESIPHTRGDGPTEISAPALWGAYSPHAWGWTIYRQWPPRSAPVFPTRVGMDLLPKDVPCIPHRIPHTRGDGP